MHRTLFVALAVTMVVSAPGCQRRAETATRVDAVDHATNAPFVARIRQVRGNVIFVQEEAGENRRAEIYISPGTEITTRDGAMFIPIANLRVNMRVTVWLGGQQNHNEGTLTASARRILVDY